MLISRVAIGLIGLALLSTAGLAADLPTKAENRIPPPPAIQWTGFYVGGHAGALWSYERHNTTAPLVEVFSQTGASWLAGGQIGYDYQWAPHALVGIEASLSGMRLSLDSPSVVNPVSRYITKNNWLATATARLGYVAGSWLIYGRGGYAAAKPEFIGTTPGDYISVSGVRNGWTLGGGVEYMILPNVSVALEYNHYDFGTKHYDSTSQILFFPVHADIAFKLDSVMIRANYRFGG